MAQVFKGSNHLHRSARRNWLSGMLFLALCLGYGYMLWEKNLESLWEICPAMLLLMLAQCFFGRYAKYRAGLKGERLSLKYAKKLPSDYFVFTNVMFGHSYQRTEIDLVVVGAKGVFVLEIKNHGGHITGDAGKEKWLQVKKTQSGKYKRLMYNPLRQAGRQAYKLAEALRTRHIGIWVESCVVFVNKAATIEITNKTRPVLTSPKEICKFILENQCTQPLDEAMVKKVAQAVRLLQQAN